MIENEDVGIELGRIARRKSNNLLVVSTYHRFLIETLFDEGYAKKMFFLTRIPMLILQHKEDSIYH